MSNEVIARPQAFSAMTADLTISMDDVVSAFVSQYENNLFARKKELGKMIKEVEDDAEANKKALLKDVDGKEWANVKMPFGLESEVTLQEVDWTAGQVIFKVSITGPEKTRYYSNSITLTKKKKMPAKYQKAQEKFEKQFAVLRGELSEVLVSLKQVARKERQVRGKIAIRKLEDSGYASLMADPELIKLVQLDDD